MKTILIVIHLFCFGAWANPCEGVYSHTWPKMKVRGNTWQYVDVRGDDLRKVDLSEANLSHASLEGAKVTEQQAKYLKSKGLSGFVIVK